MDYIIQKKKKKTFGEQQRNSIKTEVIKHLGEKTTTFKIRSFQNSAWFILCLAQYESDPNLICKRIEYR